MSATIGRRSFFLVNLAIGGFAIGLSSTSLAGEPSSGPAATLQPNPFIHIAKDGSVTIVCHRSEMGQGVRSTIVALIAAELGADPSRVALKQAVGDKKYGDQNTDGSTSIRKFYDKLRNVGAAARTMLVEAAAKQWKVKPGTCDARGNSVHHPSTKRSLAFADLVESAAKLPVPKDADLVLRQTKDLTDLMGTLPFVDAPAFVDGTALYGADIKLPNMLVAVIARPPVVGGKATKVDSSKALAIPGVKRVIEMPAPKKPWMFQPWGGVAVLADNTWAAMRGRAALEITWDHGENAAYDSSTFRDTMLASVRAEGSKLRSVGDTDAAFGKAVKTLEAEYLVPHLPHLPMEPPVAIARVENGQCEIWAPTQNPQAARTEAARVLGIGEEKVTVNVTLLGGGFGRKSKADFVSEACFLAREAKVPVRVQWTREDDVKHGYYNAVNAQRIRAALDDKGKVVGWHHRTAFTPIASIFNAGADRPSEGDLQQGILDLALDVPNIRAEACAAKAQSRVGWFRSVYNIFHAFGTGSFIDEIAHARGEDPRTVWLELIGPARTLTLADLGVADLKNYGETLTKHPVDAGRLRKVVERVTDAAQWDKRKASSRSFGLAAHRSFVSYVAAVVSVVPDERNKIRVDEAWISIDAGTVVNRDRAIAQMQGAVVMGISNALFGGVTMKGGITEQSNFRDARIARIAETPRKIHVDIVPSDGPPCGVGEPGVPPVGPALANAVFALTGKRIRETPLLRSL